MSKKQHMRTEQKSNVKNSVSRLATVTLLVILQVWWMVFVMIRVNDYSALIATLTKILALIVVLGIYGRHVNSAFKLPWIMLILVFPVIGLCLYALMGRPNTTKKMAARFDRIDQQLFPFLPQNDSVFHLLEERDLSIANQARYVWKYAHYPVYNNTDVTYYPDAVQGLQAQIADLSRAEKFIFMEYHAIEDAESFSLIRDILAKKAREGVEVRLFYDDIGSIGFIDPGFIDRMKELGIRCRVFNPIVPILNIFMNNRDHRKITVIDGKVGFTGGYNLANEYFHVTQPFGYWKDTGIRLEGDAVRSLTITFLEMWNAVRDSDIDDVSFDRYLPEPSYRASENGYVQPYADSPLDADHVGENVYMDILKNAKKYCYFITPYLVITDEMGREFSQAARRGVDVRIITPGIPDKKVIYQVTRSYYSSLCRNGVKIYEYTPGFCHAKMCVSDDVIATVGTINLDFRSLYLHFENGCLLYGCKMIREIREDFDRMFLQSAEVTGYYRYRRKLPLRIAQCILRLFAPLL